MLTAGHRCAAVALLGGLILGACSAEVVGFPVDDAGVEVEFDASRPSADAGPGESRDAGADAHVAADVGAPGGADAGARGDASARGDAGAGRRDAGGPDAQACPPPILISRPGHVFTPSLAAPIYHEDIPMDRDLVLRRIEVDVTFKRGPWASPAPSSGGIHNVFWLHRGRKGDKWLNNCAGYVNIKGLRTLEANDNLGITDAAIWNQAISQSFHAVEGETYEVRYVYDAVGSVYSLKAFHAGQLIVNRSGDPLLDQVEAANCWPGSGCVHPGFFFEMGQPPWDGSGGPEVPSYGWDYSDVELRFYPVCP